MSVTISELKSGLATALSAELDNETPLVVATYTRERGWVVFHSGDPADPLAVPTGECEIAPEPNLNGIESTILCEYRRLWCAPKPVRPERAESERSPSAAKPVSL